MTVHTYIYTATVTRVDGTTKKVRGQFGVVAVENDTRTEQELDYAIKCFILNFHFKPGEAVGTMNVELNEPLQKLTIPTPCWELAMFTPIERAQYMVQGVVKAPHDVYWDSFDECSIVRVANKDDVQQLKINCYNFDVATELQQINRD